jgi:enamine deaminase RidA (YjgF/YER057c/UK114 family)
MKVINPPTLGRPSGYANGVLTPPGVRVLFVAGQIGWDERQRLVSEDFAAQFERALRNVLEVVREAGGAPGSIGRMTVYVTDKREYLARRAELGAAWRELLGRHYPAMTLVEVKDLLEDGAKVEIEATAVL